MSSPRAGPSVATALLVVDVVGKVRRPGIYPLPAGARVDDAVRAAGGLLAGVDPVTVNLARKLADGEQLVIGRAVPGGAAAGGAGQAPPGRAVRVRCHRRPAAPARWT